MMPPFAAALPASSEGTLQTVHVALADRSYPIHIGRDLCSSLPDWLQSQCGQSRHAVMVYDQNVEPIADRYGAELKQAAYRLTRLAVPSGEAAKSIAEATRLWDAMLDDHTDRGSLVIAVGGGVVGEITPLADGALRSVDDRGAGTPRGVQAGEFPEIVVVDHTIGVQIRCRVELSPLRI